MASFKKIKRSAIVNLNRHHSREIQNNSNEDIDVEKSEYNYELCERDLHPYDYFKQRLSEVYCIEKNDLVVMGEWVVTAPKTMPPEYQEQFFKETKSFLDERYGEVNCVRATVHMDEATPHMHYDFIPVTDGTNAKYCITHGFTEKVSCNSVVNRHDLRNFHSDFQRRLDKSGIPGAKVKTGVTVAQGGNRTVREMKQGRTLERKRAWLERDRNLDRSERGL